MYTDILSHFLLPLSALAATLLAWAVLSALPYIELRGLKQAPVTVTENSTDSSLAENRQLNSAQQRVQSALGAVIATPVVLITAYIVALYIPSVAKGIDAITTLVVGGAALWGFAFFSWHRGIRCRREISWQQKAEKMVDAAVTALIPRGYVVIRDFTTGQVSIDYLLIGPKGVFAMQTLVHPVPGKSDPSLEVTVTYDGRTLFFPDNKDDSSAAQADACAEQLSEWLSSGLSTPIAARAILALPGWQIKRISAQGISVIHPGQLEALFQYVKPRPLSEEDALQIIQRIESARANPTNRANENPVRETAC